MCDAEILQSQMKMGLKVNSRLSIPSQHATTFTKSGHSGSALDSKEDKFPLEATNGEISRFTSCRLSILVDAAKSSRAVKPLSHRALDSGD
jgi:hypothetical protein